MFSRWRGEVKTNRWLPFVSSMTRCMGTSSGGL